MRLFGLLLLVLQAATVTPRPPVFFHEDWKIPPGQDPRRILTQEWVNSPSLELKQYGPGTKGHGVEHQDVARLKDFAGSLIVNTHGEPNNWAYIWSGFAEGNWAFTLREKNWTTAYNSPSARAPPTNQVSLSLMTRTISSGELSRFTARLRRGPSR